MRAPLSFVAILFCGLVAFSNATAAPRAVLADAVVDLRTSAGAALVGATWRYHDAAIIEVDHRAPGADLKPSGAPLRTHDIAPKAGAADFDDSTWEIISADSLEARRSTGRLAFGWYHLRFTMPAQLGDFAAIGSMAVLEIVVDDYAEVWVNGRLTQTPGSTGGAFPSGWNSVQRVVLGRDLQPGAVVQLAIFAANGPLSEPPPNYVWLRSATLDFYSAERSRVGEVVPFKLTRFDSAIDAVISADAKLEKLADGFAFTEGPVWLPADGGNLLFSDPNNNRIYRWSPVDGAVSVYRTKSGYSGVNIGEYHQPGSNGLTLDSAGRLTIAEHGNRRITRLEKNGVLTVLAERFEGHRFNSPNDLVYRSDGTLFFTDPFFGLPKYGEDPRRESPITGVYAVREGRVTLVTAELSGPNGIAFSPDEKFLYVGNWDDHRKVVMRYTLGANDAVARSEVFADLTAEPGDDAIDGLKVDERRNVYVSGPGGVWIFSAEGKRLGLLHGPEHPHNLAWGDADHRTLYLAAQTGIYRLRVANAGSGAALQPKL